MVMPLGIAASGVGAVEGLLDNGDKDNYAKLCEIASYLQSLVAYNTRERERTPYVQELACTFTAGVRSAVTDWMPPSSFMVDYFVFTATVAAVELELRMGTRGPRFITSSGSQPLALPYHLNGGQALSLQDPSGAANVTVKGFVVGWFEQNRLSNVRDQGDVNS